MKLIFRDNFFSRGETEIIDEQSMPAGVLDLKSSFGSSVDIFDKDGRLACSGKFRSFSSKWEVEAGGRTLGVLRYRFSWTKKKYEYDAFGRGRFEITSPAFSKEYDIHNSMGKRIAAFERVSGWFASGAYALDNITEELDSYELVALIMGVHSIQKRHNSAAST